MRATLVDIPRMGYRAGTSPYPVVKIAWGLGHVPCVTLLRLNSVTLLRRYPVACDPGMGRCMVEGRSGACPLHGGRGAPGG